MPALAWQFLTFGVVGLSLVVITFRTLAIARLPIHLRWELAPLPNNEERGGYGGSYLEEYEWWTKPQHHSRVAALIYTAKEIFFLRTVWNNNRRLWPLTLVFHIGLYLIAGLSLLLATYSVLTTNRLTSLPVQILHNVISVLALLGYLLGSIGSIGLLLKRALNRDLKPFTTISRYFNLLLLAVVFLSGSYTWIHSGDYITEVINFARGLITLDPNLSVAFPFSFHILMALLFLLYMPLTDMIHFIAKYFTYHFVRWDDRPNDEMMEMELGELLTQPVTWSAPHVGRKDRKTWTDIVTTEARDEATS